MFHEYLQTDIVGENGLSVRARCVAIHACRHMGRRRVELGEKETSLTSTLITNDVPRNGESICQKVLWNVDRNMSMIGSKGDKNSV